MNRKLFDRLIVVDTETGGLDPINDAVLTIAAVTPLGRELEVRVWDHARTSPEAMAVNKIDLGEHMRHAIRPHEAARQLSSFIELAQEDAPGSLILAGHNPGFDHGFIQRLYRLAREQRPRDGSRAIEVPKLFRGMHRTVDTHTLLWVKALAGEIPDDARSLDGALKHYGIKVGEGERHTALGDARATLSLLRRLVLAE